jgi:ribonucleoside-diphosphate reductase alpha chain
LEPVVNIPRRTVGRMALINPEELNGQINFLTTSGLKVSPLI